MFSFIGEYLAGQARKPSGWFGRTVATRVFDRENRPMQQYGLQLMAPEEDDRVLEIGFGNGWFLSQLMPHLREGAACGIDLSADMVEVASRRNRRWIESGRLELRQASISDIPYPDGRFDKAFTCNTIYFWPDPEANLREVKRVLKERGEFSCALRLGEEMRSKNAIVRRQDDIFRNLYEAEEVRELFASAGFENIELQGQSEGDDTYHMVRGTA